MAVGEKGKQLAELAPCTFAACDRSQLAATSCREYVPKIAELWDNFKGRTWNSTVSVPDHCLLIYFVIVVVINLFRFIFP